MSQKNNNELPKQAAENTLNLNPVIGIRGKDLLTSARMVLLQAVRQPLHSARHVAHFSLELKNVLLGQSELRPGDDDRRFSDPAWSQNPLYKRYMQTYLAWRKELHSWISHSDLSPQDISRGQFVINLLTEAMSPTNSLSNPAAVKRFFETGGKSLLDGLGHLAKDLVNNGGMPSQVDMDAFEVGKNLATTEGAVVFRNDVLELIQYRPITESVHEHPLLVVPPQINKYYIFDLSPEKSFVQYALKNNLQVFVISWRNPDAQHREWGLSTYVEALDQAIEVSREITGSRSVNLAGACAGGLTVAALLGHLQVRRQLRKVSSVTYLVSLLDSQMESPAMLFADEQTLESSKRRSYQHGVLDGRDMAKVFAWMRPNDLIWNYWVNNYLLGRQPPAFDILYWNNDNTRLPAAFHGELLDLFKHNPLTRPGALEVSGTAVDLGKVAIDSFHVAGITDHITPWDAVYRSALLLGGQRRFILSNSGHIQSILNPPGNPKACYFENDKLSSDPRAWYYDAKREEGSWWPVWLGWLQERSGELGNPDFNLGSAAHPPLEAAPGTYVHIR